MKRDTIGLVLAFLLAAVIWLISNLSKPYSGIVAVQVQAVSNITGHSDLSSNTASAVARCRTTGYNLISNKIRKSRRVVKVNVLPEDLKRGAGDEFFLAGPVREKYIPTIFGEGTVLESFITDTLKFTFPSVSSKKVPVEMVKSFDFRSQYTNIGPIRLKPDSVTVYCDALHLENIDRVYTVPLTISDIHGSLHGSLKINRLRGVRLSDDEIEYDMEVSRYVEIRVTRNLEVRNAPPGRRLQVYPSSCTVVYRCKFPPTRDVTGKVDFYIDYRDFAESMNGRCIPRPTAIPGSVIDYRLEPEVFECFEIR